MKQGLEIKYRQATIIKDSPYRLNYEVPKIGRRMLNILLIPLLNAIPFKYRNKVKQSHGAAKEVIEKATSHAALEVLYGKGYPHLSRSIWEKFAHRIWFNTNNSVAARNRLTLVKDELQRASSKYLSSNQDINLVSIASGSARAVIETMCTIKIPETQNISLTFLDKNPEAIEYSKKLSKKCPSRYRLRWIQDTASRFGEHFDSSELVNIVEMVGLLDYFDEIQTLKILKVIHNNLEKGGTMIIANINDNQERKFVTNLVGWPMIYKSAEELIDIAIAAGFDPLNIRSIYEPLEIHHVLIATK
ncbi:MAG: hypothetical protein Q8Q18_00635 [bacterium]|nr:hypothetical protein [bacterium]